MLAIARAFDIIPGWVYAAVMAALLLVLGGEFISHSNTRNTLNQERAAWAQATQQAQQAALEQSEKYRAIEKELSHAQEVNAAEVSALFVELEYARTAAGLASGRVRDAAASAAARARAQCANSAAAGLRPSTDDPIGVLADVLGRCDARAGLLADLADRRGIAGNACQRAYDEAFEALSRAAR